jgi:hypothetical protein
MTGLISDELDELEEVVVTALTTAACVIDEDEEVDVVVIPLAWLATITAVVIFALELELVEVEDVVAAAVVAAPNGPLLHVFDIGSQVLACQVLQIVL